MQGLSLLVLLATLASAAPREKDPTALANLPGDVRESFGSLLSWDLLPHALVIAGATGLSAPFDDDGQEYFGRAERLGDAGEIASNAAVLAGGFGAVLAAGWLSENERHRTMSYDLMQGLLVANGVTYAIKLTARRERPDEGPHSFPSGHAANVFTLSSILGHHYGWKVAVPLHAFATFVSLSRLDLDSHWVSDTVAGAGIGLLVGHAVVRKRALPSPSPNLSWTPVFPPGGVGVQFSWRARGS